MAQQIYKDGISAADSMTNSQTKSYKNGDRYYGGLPKEPSDLSYGKIMDQIKNDFNNWLKKNNIESHQWRENGTIKRQYTGNFDGNDFGYLEAEDSFTGRKAPLEFKINGRKVNLKKSGKKIRNSLSPISHLYDVETIFRPRKDVYPADDYEIVYEDEEY